MPFTLSPSALENARRHAMRDYPNESCGLIVDGAYEPQFNYASEPTKDFIIPGEVFAGLHAAGRTVEAVVHSHPDGPIYPSERDMQGQLDTDLPWVIIPTNGQACDNPIIWGEGVDRGPLLGRPFIHGVTDCYELVRDVFAAGREELARQEITDQWLLEPLKLRPQARADGWWDAGTECAHRDLYADFRGLGFREIAPSEVQPGDCFLMKLGYKITQLNHGGVFLGRGLIIHHLPTRVSRREPMGLWLRAVDKWLRHEALDAVLAAQTEMAHAA